MILVDSSIWIGASKKTSAEYWQLTTLIKKNAPIAYTSLIQVEVCQGSKTQAQYDGLWDAFLGFTRIDCDDETYSQASWHYFSLRKKGITVGTIDCIIATLARQRRVQLWSADQHFKQMAPIIGLNLFSFTE